MKNKMTIQELMEMYNMTIHQLIEMIKLKGEAIELNGSVFGLPDEKYGERVIILFENRYYVTYTILDNFIEKVYHEDITIFENESKARDNYDDLLLELNGEAYEY